MNPLKRFIDDLGRTPVVPLMGLPGIQLTGISINEALFNAQNQISSLLALSRAVQPDALFTMMDLTVEAEFLGSDLKLSDEDLPAVSGHILEDEADLEVIFGDKPTGGRMALFAEVVSGLKDELDIPVCAYVIGPLTLAGELMDITVVMKATRKNPELLHRVLANSTRVIMGYASLLENAGADLICILEPSAVMMSAKIYWEFSGRYCSKIISEGIAGMSVLHICGDTNHLIAEMAKTGANGLSLDKQVDLPSANDCMGGDTVLIGNIDPVSVVNFDDEEMVKRKSRALYRSMNARNNFILSTGCDVPPNAPIENLVAMMQAADDSGGV